MFGSDRPTLLGVSKDSNDADPYMDINLSLQTPLFYDQFTGQDEKDCSGKFLPYFGFNYIGAFYVGTRPSGPVVGKTFNPLIRGRIFLDSSNVGQKDRPDVKFLDVEYGHLSNGQTVSSQSEFNAQAAELHSPRDAEDYISRGWDYVGATLHWYFGSPDNGQAPGVLNKYQSISISYRNYIGGYLQKSIEEYYPAIEPPRSITSLKQVKGFRLVDKIGTGNRFLSSVAVALETGIHRPFMYNSVRVDTELLSRYFQPRLSGFSLDLWASVGHDANLVHYYERVSSIGLALLFETQKSDQSPSRVLTK